MNEKLIDLIRRNWCGDYWKAVSAADAEEINAALSRTPNPAVNVGAVVKALEWKEEADCDAALTPFGAYRVGWRRGRVSWGFSNDVSDGQYEWPGGESKNIEEAKAAAQADYEKRILSALTSPQGEETPAAPSPQADVRPLELLDRADDEAIEWVTSNCMAIRRDDGSFHYNLSQIVRAFQAGKASATPPAPQPNVRARFLLEDCASYIDALHRKHKTQPFDMGIDTATLRTVAASLIPSPQPKPSNETRQTFTVPDGHYAVRGEDGRATGEVRPLPEPETIADDIGRCPICAEAFNPADICATDIEMGSCHAECLDGAPVVDLDTGDEIPDGKISTYPYSEVMDPPPQERETPTLKAPDRDGGGE
jgi:hypothetical protein